MNIKDILINFFRFNKKQYLIKIALIIFLASLIIINCSEDESEIMVSHLNVKIVQVKDLGAIETNTHIKGRDGGYSCVFDGKSVWLYGDTILDKADIQGSTWHNNSWSWTKDFDASDNITNFQEKVDSLGVPTEFFSLTVDEKSFNAAHKDNNGVCSEQPCGAKWAIWPCAIVPDIKRKRALVFYSKVYTEPGSFNGIGNSIALWNSFDESPIRPVINSDAQYPTILFSENEPNFGSSALVIDSDLYAYGCKSEGFEKKCHLGRVPLNSVLDKSSWEYYAGNASWIKDINSSANVFNGNDILSVFYNKYFNCYFALYSQPMGTNVMLRTSLNLEGPWSDPILIFKAKAANGFPGWVYDALAHPEFSINNGRIIFISYSRSTGDWQSEVRLVSVELAY